MQIDAAIVSALEYEKRVRDHYRDSEAAASNPKAREFFRVMADEEQGHVDYLEFQLAQWQKSGVFEGGGVASVIPSRQWLEEGLARLQAVVETRDYGPDLARLHTALRLEQETTDHYRTLVAAAEHPDAAAMFRRFLEIEDGHTAVVQAEIDMVSHSGFFFDLQEFTLDG